MLTIYKLIVLLDIPDKLAKKEQVLLDAGDQTASKEYGPVSYTHLDVYKRQLTDYRFRLFQHDDDCGYGKCYSFICRDV